MVRSPVKVTRKVVGECISVCLCIFLSAVVKVKGT